MNITIEQVVGVIVTILSLLIFFRMILKDGLKFGNIIKSIVAIGLCVAVLKEPAITITLGQLLISLLETIITRIIGGINNG